MRRPPAFIRYSPGRRDARVAEARSFLTFVTPAKLAALEPHAIECQFNLKPQTAETVLQYEKLRRVGAS